jgi:hypothetical protein
VFFLSGFISGMVQYFKNPKPPDGLTIEQCKQWYDQKLWLQDNETDNNDVQLQERILLLDETIVKYNKLLDNLTEQYNYTMDEKKRSVILSKQIITLEKLNRALEKREKLE